MKLKIDRAELLYALNIVIKAVPGHTTMPILECVLVTAQDGKITLSAYDMEMGIKTAVDGEIIEDGIVAIEAKMLLDIIKKMPDDITITVGEGDKALITSGRTKFNIACRNGLAFPAIPEIEAYDSITMSQYTLKNIIMQTIFSIDETAANKVMTGEHIQIDHDKLKVTSLDGHRISIRTSDLRNSYDPVSAIIPGKTLLDISKILSSAADEDVSISFEENNALFAFGKTTIVSRLIAGKFFEVEKMINIQPETTITINKRALAESIDRATIFIKDGERKPVVFETHDGYIDLRLTSQLGEMHESIDCSVDGKPIKIGLNPKFLTDILKAIEVDEVNIYLSGAKNPLIIKDDDYLYLALPVAMSA